MTNKISRFAIALMVAAVSFLSIAWVYPHGCQIQFNAPASYYHWPQHGLGTVTRGTEQIVQFAWSTNHNGSYTGLPTELYTFSEGTYRVTFTVVGSTSTYSEPFTVPSSCHPTAVFLLTFNAWQAGGNKINLVWEVMQELGTVAYQINRNGIPIFTVPAEGAGTINGRVYGRVDSVPISLMTWGNVLTYSLYEIATDGTHLIGTQVIVLPGKPGPGVSRPVAGVDCIVTL